MARDRSRTRVVRHATPSLGAVTWQRLAWAVEDRLGGSAGTSSELRVDAPSVGESALSPEHWQFLAQAGFALDESSSVDDLEATVLGLVVPRLADLCVVRHPRRASGGDG